MSTRVVTSKVRQLPGWGANWRSAGEAIWARLVAGSAAAAVAEARFNRKMRRACA
jgi:hypothetical protein